LQNPRNLPLAALAFSNLLVLILSAHLLLQTRTQNELRAQVLTQNIAGAVDRNLTSSIQKIDLALHAIIDAVEREIATKHPNKIAIERLMRLQASRLPEAAGVRLANAQGLMVMGEGVDPRMRISIADRDYFKQHRDHDTQQLGISNALISRLTGKPVVIFSRRFNLPQNRFGGVLYVAVPVERLAINLSGFDLGLHGTVQIRGADLGLIADVHGPGGERSGQVIGGISQAVLSWAASGARTATLRIRTGPESREAVVTLRRLDNLPVIAVAAVAEQDFLADWWDQARGTAAIDVSVLLMSLLAARTLTRLLAQAESRERRVATSEQGLKHAQQIAGLGSFSWQLESGELLWSDGHFVLWGLEPQSAPPTYALFLQAIHPDDLPRIMEDDARLTHWLGPYDREYRLRLADGNDRDILDQGLVFIDPETGRRRMVGTVQDITRLTSDATAMRRAGERQEVLRRVLELVLQGGQVESVLTQALEALFAITWISASKQGAVLAANPSAGGLQACAVVALDPGLVLSRAWLRTSDCSDGHGAEDWPAQVRAGAAAQDARIAVDGDGWHWVPIVSGSRLLGLLLICRSGEARDPAIDDLLVSMASILATYFLRDEAERALAAQQQDLEQRVCARTAELQTSESRARALLALLMEGVAHLSANGKILSVNRPVMDMFGFLEADLLGQHFSTLVPGSLPNTSSPRGQGRESSTGAEYGHGPRELAARRRDGSTFPLEFALSRFEDASDTSFIVLLRDLTAQKRREVELQEALNSAQDATLAKGRFLANMSHEIRTPLNAILGLAKIGKRPGAAESTIKLLDRIGEAGEHLLGLVNDILDTSKIEAGKLSVECKPFQLRSKVDGVVRFFTGRAETKRLDLRIDIASSVPEWVEGDAMRLAQILANLLANALKFTPSGSVVLAIRNAGSEIEFEVSDTGIGMSEEQIARLFQRFEQADSSTTRNYGGTGLGLSICRDLAALMGGSIEVISRLGAGSHFTLRLPMARARAPSAAEDAEGPAIKASGGRLEGVSVLAADDVEMNRLVLEDLLISEGARVVFAGNGQIALDLLREAGADRFNVVLMDVQMPLMDGLEATRRMVAIAPQLPIIGLTAHTLEEEHAKCIDAGMRDVVTKPVDTTALVQAIRRQIAALPPPVAASGEALPPLALPQATSDAQGAIPATIEPIKANGAIAGPPPIDWTALLARFKGRRPFVAKLLASIQGHHSETPARLRAAAIDSERATLGFLVHGLKGVSGSLEAPALRTLATTMDAQLRTNAEVPVAQVEALAQCLEAVLAELSTSALLELTLT
jgi:PAS domain S-box-containing protein